MLWLIWRRPARATTSTMDSTKIRTRSRRGMNIANASLLHKIRGCQPRDTESKIIATSRDLPSNRAMNSRLLPEGPQLV